MGVDALGNQGALGGPGPPGAAPTTRGVDGDSAGASLDTPVGQMPRVPGRELVEIGPIPEGHGVEPLARAPDIDPDHDGLCGSCAPSVPPWGPSFIAAVVCTPPPHADDIECRSLHHLCDLFLASGNRLA